MHPSACHAASFISTAGDVAGGGGGAAHPVHDSSVAMALVRVVVLAAATKTRVGGQSDELRAELGARLAEIAHLASPPKVERRKPANLVWPRPLEVVSCVRPTRAKPAPRPTLASNGLPGRGSHCADTGPRAQ